MIPGLSRRAAVLGVGAAGLVGAGSVRPRAAATPGDAGARLVEATLEARAATLEVGGERVRLLTYNGAYPGPVLRAREGDRLRVTLVNGLDEPTNLHFHGLHVSPSGNSDNVFVELQPGERFGYELVVPAGFGGTFWYHPHRHRHLADQLWRGLAGPLIIDRPLDRPIPELAAADEQLVVIKDLTIVGGEPAPHTISDWARGKSGRLVLANGLVQPTLQARAPLVRLRLVNACNARMLLLARDDGEPLPLIAHEGHLIEAPLALPEILVTPAQRIELLLPLDPGRTVTLLHKPYGTGAQKQPWRPEPLFAVRAPERGSASALPARLAEVERLDATAADVHRSFKMAMAFLMPDGHDHLHPIEARLGDLELWTITNVDTQDHVFHLHTWPFQVWRRDGVPPAYAAWRDTIDLRPGETVEILVPFRDFAGRSVFHCHIAEHGDAGMMGIVEVRAY